MIPCCVYEWFLFVLDLQTNGLKNCGLFQFWCVYIKYTLANLPMVWSQLSFYECLLGMNKTEMQGCYEMHLRWKTVTNHALNVDLIKVGWNLRKLLTFKDLHYENTPIQIYWKFYNFQIKMSDIFHISSQNINCWYSFEPPWRCGSDEYMYPQSMFLSRNKKK